MRQSVILAGLAAFTAFAINAQGQVINFTAAEGYVNGPLHTQIGYKWWSSDAPTAWQADTTGTGRATISSSAGDWKKITYNLGSSYKSGYAGAFDVSFTLSGVAAGATTLFDFGLQDSANSWKGPAIELKAHPSGGFSMDIWNNVSSTFTSAGVSGAGMGLSAAGTGSSANLRFGFTTTATGPNAWATVLRLDNLDTATQLASFTQDWTGQGWFDVIALEQAQMSTLSGPSGSISLDRITITAVPEPATGVMLLAAFGLLMCSRLHKEQL